MGPVTSLSAGPKRGAWVLTLRDQARHAWKQLPQRPVTAGLCGPGCQHSAPGRERGRPAPQERGLWVGVSGRQGSGPARKSSLPFLLVLGTRPCRELLVAMSSCTRVEMPFFGLAGPVLAGSQRPPQSQAGACRRCSISGAPQGTH